MAITVNYEPNPALTGYLEAYGAAGQSAQQGAQMLEQQQERQHQQRMQEAQFAASQLPSPRDVFHQQAQMQSAVAHTQLQSLLHGTQLSQSEQIRMQRMENAVGEISSSTTLNDQEKADAITQIRTGLDPLHQRMQQAQLLQHQQQAQQAQQQATLGGAVQRRVLEALNSGDMSQLIQTINVPAGTDENGQPVTIPHHMILLPDGQGRISHQLINSDQVAAMSDYHRAQAEALRAAAEQRHANAQRQMQPITPQQTDAWNRLATSTVDARIRNETRIGPAPTRAEQEAHDAAVARWSPQAREQAIRDEVQGHRDRHLWQQGQQTGQAQGGAPSAQFTPPAQQGPQRTAWTSAVLRASEAATGQVNGMFGNRRDLTPQDRERWNQHIQDISMLTPLFQNYRTLQDVPADQRERALTAARRLQEAGIDFRVR